MNTELQLHITPVQITGNFDELKRAIQQFADDHSFVVTQDNLPDAKTARTELSRLIKQLNRQRIDRKKEMSAPIDQFEASMKDAIGAADVAHEDLDEQVKSFEAMVKRDAEEQLAAYQSKQWDARGVEAEFRTSLVDDLVKVSALTKKNELTKASREGVEALVANDLAFQNQTRARLANLEAASYRAGLSQPLAREHVESFLFADGADYNTALDAMLAREISRQQAIVEQERRKAEAAAQREADARVKQEVEAARQQAQAEARIEAQAHVDELQQKREQKQAQDEQAAPAGRDLWHVEISYQITTPAGRGITEQQVKNKVLSRLAEAGLTEFNTLDIRHVAS